MKDASLLLEDGATYAKRTRVRPPRPRPDYNDHVHFAPSDPRELACSLWYKDRRVTSNPAEVTCKRCRLSGAFKIAGRSA